jgi:hypothetical protein
LLARARVSSRLLAP